MRRYWGQAPAAISKVVVVQGMAREVVSVEASPYIQRVQEARESKGLRMTPASDEARM